MAKISKNSMNQLIELHKLELIARQNLKQGNLYKSLEMFQRIFDLKKGLKNVGGQCRALSLMGQICYELGDIQQCKFYHSQLTSLLDTFSSIKIKCDYFIELRDFYLKIHDNETAEYYNKRIPPIKN